MTKKDYELIANVINLWRSSALTATQGNRIIDDLINEFSFELGLENPRFDPVKFKKACLEIV